MPQRLLPSYAVDHFVGMPEACRSRRTLCLIDAIMASARPLDWCSSGGLKVLASPLSKHHLLNGLLSNSLPASV